MAEFPKKIKSIKILRDIKPSYLIKGIFSFLNEKKKLDMIMYNKKLQKIFLLCLKDYKKISGKYIVGERNGKGKEYYINNNVLTFEGDYLNGKRNGKGKEYNYKGEIVFEGEYLNGKRNGKGKQKYDNGELEFEGEYLNGKIWNGKGYNINGNLEFEIKNGNGNIKEYYTNGELMFEGEYLNGKRKGKGTEYNNNRQLIF